MSDAGRSRWYSSFYWRIGLSFVVLVAVVLVAQSVMFSYIVQRAEQAVRAPNATANTIAVRLAARWPGTGGACLLEF